MDPVVNLTGATIRWKVSRTPIDKATPTDILIVAPDNGIFEITINEGDTIDLNGEYYHECKLVDSMGNVSTIFTGLMKVKPGLIR